MARLGIGYVPEGRGIFPNLVGAREPGDGGARRRATARRDWTLERVLATFPRLAERLDHGGQQLSGGEQQMLAIGRALMTNPRPAHPRRSDRRPGAADRRARSGASSREIRDTGIATLIVDRNYARRARPHRPRGRAGEGPRRRRRRIGGAGARTALRWNAISACESAHSPKGPLASLNRWSRHDSRSRRHPHPARQERRVRRRHRAGARNRHRARAKGYIGTRCSAASNRRNATC